MYWAPFFHIYQPPDQNPFILERIANESYRPLIKGWLNNSQARVTLNINACLTEMLFRQKYLDVLENLKQLAERKQLEFTASAKFHPFLPILPKKEIIRQIQLNEQTNKKYFGKVYKPLGFFPPEMGVNEKVVEVVKSLGYKWIIMDEIAFKGKIEQVASDRLYFQKSGEDTSGVARSDSPEVEETGNFLFFRHRRLSNLIMSAMIRTSQSLGEAVSGSDKYFITAMDGETFGHHRPGLDNLLLDLYSDKHYQMATISDLLTLISDREDINQIVPSTWASSEKEIEEGKNFYLYYNPSNKLHRLQKRLIDLAIKTVSGKDTFEKQLAVKTPRVEEYKKTRHLLDQVLSCNHMWWSNPDAFWSIEEIEKGAYNLKQIFSPIKYAAASVIGEIFKNKAEELYRKILDTAFSWQRQGLPQRLHEEKEKFKKVPFKQRAKPGEYEALLEILKEEEKKAVQREEYELAIRWRDSRYKLEKGLDVYDFVHIIDQMRAEGRLGKYEELAKKYREEYKKWVPGQPDK